MERRSLAVALSLVVLLGLAQLPAQGALVVRAGGGSFVFSPRAPHVAVGTRVTWRSTSGRHTVSATSSNWTKNTTLASTGSTTSFNFRRAGTYRYRCRLHSSVVGGRCTGMCGRVIVP
ncbi:MAG: cupredoxin domain-containing protein [Actinomycetota bacterium]